MMQHLYKKIHLNLPAENTFTELAEYLFFNCHLSVNGKKFYFTELEFYLETDGHRDLFRHNAAKQIEDNKIYAHNSGMDITCGNGKDLFCGVLVRGLKDETGEFYNGPLVSIQRGIFAQLGITETYSKGKHADVLAQQVCLKENNSPQEKSVVFQGPRHGLGMGRFGNDDAERYYFKYAPYRYIIDVDVQKHSYADKEKCTFVSAVLNKPVKDPQKILTKAKEWAELYAYYKEK